jgi:serine/threonine protein kinase
MRYSIYNKEFETISILGQGAFGKVLYSIRRDDGKIFAIKEIDVTKSKYSEDKLIRMTNEEVGYLIQLSYNPCNPNVVCYYDMFQDSSSKKIYIVMEYIPGRDLSQTVEAINLSSSTINEKFTYEFVLSMVKYLLEAINYVHSKGIVHGDIKSANIVARDTYEMIDTTNSLSITHNYRPVLLDFGLSCQMGNDSCDKMFGTPQYIAPEVLINGRLDPASDIWSLGITTIKALGLDPWAGVKELKNGNIVKFFQYLKSMKVPPKLNTSNILLSILC